MASLELELLQSTWTPSPMMQKQQTVAKIAMEIQNSTVAQRGQLVPDSPTFTSGFQQARESQSKTVPLMVNSVMKRKEVLLTLDVALILKMFRKFQCCHLVVFPRKIHTCNI